MGHCLLSSLPSHLHCFRVIKISPGIGSTWRKSVYTGARGKVILAKNSTNVHLSRSAEEEYKFYTFAIALGKS